MTNILTDILAIIGVVLNGLPQGLLALTFGFASIPTAMAFFIGAIGNTLTQSVAPISFQAETITYAGSAGKDRSERCTMIFFGAVIMALIGAFGLLTKIVDFIGEDIAFGMMAGVAMMIVIGVILIMGVLPKISKYVPASSIAGFLFVLGIFKTVALDAPAALAANAAVGGSTLVVTAVTNPFLGMVAGIVVRMLGI